MLIFIVNKCGRTKILLYYQFISTPTLLGWSKDTVVDTLKSERRKGDMDHLKIQKNK